MLGASAVLALVLAALALGVTLLDIPADALSGCGSYGYACLEPACVAVEISKNYGYTWQKGTAWVYGPPGSQIDLYIRTTLTTTVGNVQGWSFGVAHTAPTLEGSGGSLSVSAAASGPGVQTVKAGGPPDFASTRPWSCGFTQGLVIDMGGGVTLGPTTNLVTAIACYRLRFPTGYSVHTVKLEFTEGVGVPPVANAVTREGQSIAPCKTSLTLYVQPTYYNPTPSYCPLSPMQPAPCEEARGGGLDGPSGRDLLEITPEELVDQGVEWLLDLQDEAGYPQDRWLWDREKNEEQGPELHRTVATTAICAEAIARTPNYSCRRRKAVARATEFILDHCDYSCAESADRLKWPYFQLHFLVKLEALQRVPPGMEDEVSEAIEGLVDSILGCFEYWDHQGSPYQSLTRSEPQTDNASFRTAVALRALRAAQAAGYTVDGRWIQGAEALQASRMEGEIGVGTVFEVEGPHPGAFTYSDSNIPIPGSYSTARATIPGSAGRIPISETAFRIWGWFDHPENPHPISEAQQVSRIRNALWAFFDAEACTEEGEPGACAQKKIYDIYKEIRDDAQPNDAHVGRYQIARWYFLYAHYSAAIAIEQLPEAERTGRRAVLLEKLEACRETDGSWQDQVIIDNKAYGTGIVLLALEEGLPDPTPGPEPLDLPFRRGDSNADRSGDVSDPVFTLGWLFLGGGPMGCPDAADANDDGSLDVTDAIYLLNYLFLGGPAPPAPFPELGPDPTPEDELGCAYYPCDP